MTSSDTARTADPAAFSALAAEDLSLGYGDRTIVGGLSMAVPPGVVTSIVGANGCGKSTLLRGLARLLPPRGGRVLLNGTDIRTLPTRDVARTVGLLPQSPVAPDGITVADLVGRGRYPHQGWFRRWTSGDDEAVQEALEVTGTLDLADRSVDELSGGQRQRVWIAMTLAQRTGLLLLDEPTTFLDIAHQVEVLDLLLELNRTQGTTVVMVLHDLTLASRYSDHLVAMLDGSVYASGRPRDVVTEDLVRDVFGLAAQVFPDPVTGTPSLSPLVRNPAHMPT
ncbi:ABC transporter ATP-binding protein [Nocardiopsis sp. NRRL B-16309]|uniref:ABC transporter ATP-binding protein n=1 Tax=Nocardiopsis sp. NRRL B-16309 TaxID=1519494 RepID=UPI0006AEA3F8|nr:ABC transporter ATP-binding protein [Nocardiopsis sp. NRRL B-16309]KOX14220.1 iron dicitrate ABC transporter ATP-binding protein [Nocardiopsis sp. NRRL B-16309]